MVGSFVGAVSGSVVRSVVGLFVGSGTGQIHVGWFVGGIVDEPVVGSFI